MTESKSETAGTPAQKSKKGMILVVLGVVVLLAAGGGATFYFTRSKAAAKAEGASKSQGSDGKERGETQGKGKEPQGVLALEPFIVNLAGDDGERYMKCTMRLVLDRFETAEKAKSDDLTITRIRDAMLGLLSSRSFDQIATPDGKESLRQDVRKRADGVLGDGKVTEVYFTELIVQ